MAQPCRLEVAGAKKCLQTGTTHLPEAAASRLGCLAGPLAGSQGYCPADALDRDPRRPRRSRAPRSRWVPRRRGGDTDWREPRCDDGPRIREAREPAARASPGRPARTQHSETRRRRAMRRGIGSRGERDRPPTHPRSRSAGARRTSRTVRPGVRGPARGGAAHRRPILAPHAQRFALAARPDALDQQAELRGACPASRRATGSAGHNRLQRRTTAAPDSSTTGGGLAADGYRSAGRGAAVRAGWRVTSVPTLVRAPGCYAFQVDGLGFSYVLAFGVQSR